MPYKMPKSASIVRRPYPRTAPCAVICRADGDQISALIGEDLQIGVCGFGDDLPSALRDLADQLEIEVGQTPIPTSPPPASTSDTSDKA